MGAGPLKGVAKRALGLLLIASLPILPGCWDRKELNEIALIRAIGIDRTEDGQIEVALLQAIPQRAGMPGSGKKRGSKGCSRPRASHPRGEVEIAAKLGRKIFAGHQEVVVLGKRLARKGIGRPWTSSRGSRRCGRMPWCS